MRHRKRSNIIIELTPLLDVILILIFIIMTNNSSKVEEAKAETARVENTITEITADYEGKLNEKNKEIEDLLAASDLKDAELDVLSEYLDIAYAKLNEGDRAELRQQLATLSGKYDSLEYLEQVVTVINVRLTPVKEADYIDVLTYSKKGDDANPALIEMDVTEDNRGIVTDLVTYLNECIDDHIKVCEKFDNAAALYIIFTYYLQDEQHFGVKKANVDSIEKALGNIVSKNGKYNIYSRTNVITMEEKK